MKCAWEDVIKWLNCDSLSKFFLCFRNCTYLHSSTLIFNWVTVMYYRSNTMPRWGYHSHTRLILRMVAALLPWLSVQLACKLTIWCEMTCDMTGKHSYSNEMLLTISSSLLGNLAVLLESVAVFSMHIVYMFYYADTLNVYFSTMVLHEMSFCPLFTFFAWWLGYSCNFVFLDFLTLLWCRKIFWYLW